MFLTRRELTYLLRLVRRRIEQLNAAFHVARHALLRKDFTEMRLLMAIRNKLWKEKIDNDDEQRRKQDNQKDERPPGAD